MERGGGMKRRGNYWRKSRKHHSGVVTLSKTKGRERSNLRGEKKPDPPPPAVSIHEREAAECEAEELLARIPQRHLCPFGGENKCCGRLGPTV